MATGGRAPEIDVLINLQQVSKIALVSGDMKCRKSLFSIGEFGELVKRMGYVLLPP